MDAILESWLQNAGSWSETMAAELIATRKLATNAAILKAVPPTPQRLLDLGCGEGWLCRRLSEEGHEMVGVDGVPELIDRARELGGGITYHCYTYRELRTQLPKDLGRFAGILINFALFEAEETLVLLDALAPLLKPGGFLLIQTVALESGTSVGMRTEDWRGFPIAYSAPMPWYYRDRACWEKDLDRLNNWQVGTISDTLHPETGQLVSWIIRLDLSQKK